MKGIDPERDEKYYYTGCTSAQFKKHQCRHSSKPVGGDHGIIRIRKVHPCF